MDENVPVADLKEVYRLIATELSSASKTNEKPEAERLKHLHQAQNLLFTVGDVSSVLDNYIDDFLNYLEDPSIKIRCFIVSFIGNACRYDPTVLKKATTALIWPLREASGNAQVQKRILITFTQLYPSILQWVAEKKSDDEARAAWEGIVHLKSQIMTMVGSNNEGIRVLCMRFLETLIICQTVKTEMSDLSKLNYSMSLNQVSRDHRFISYRQLDTEATQCFKSLMDHLMSSHTSLLHLIATVTAVAKIARARPNFVPSMLEAFESLNLNLPPTLGTGQVKSIRKELKLNLLRLLKHPAVYGQHLSRLQPFLGELGASDNEIARNSPNREEIRAVLKRQVEHTEALRSAKRRETMMAAGPSSKKSRVTEDEYGDQRSATAFDDHEEASKAQQEAIEITTDWIMERLTGPTISKLVYINLVTMPDEMPVAFNASYTSVPREITSDHRRHLSRMLAIQFTRENKGPGAKHIADEKKKFYEAKQKAKEQGAAIPPTPADLRDESLAKTQQVKNEEFKVPLLPSRAKKSTIKLDIFRETKAPLKKEGRELRLVMFKRMMQSEVSVTHPEMRRRLYQSLVCITTRLFNHVTPELEEQLLNFVISDQKKRGDVIIYWLDELYNQMQGISNCIKDDKESFMFSRDENNARYDALMVNCLTQLFTMNEHKELLFHRIFLEAKVITPGALLILRKACLDPASCAFSMATLRELIINRNRERHEFLKLMLELSYVEQHIVRHESIQVAKELFLMEHIQSDVRDYVNLMCERVTESTVPPIIWSSSDDAVANMEPEEIQWNEQYAKAALSLPLSLIPLDTTMINVLTKVCATAQLRVKRFLVTAVDKYCTQLRQDDENFLSAIDECPSGGEALMAKFVTYLTSKSDPSPELVKRMKALQERYNSDIRSLIPIIPGLTKEECLDLVPKFVLNSTSMRSVPIFYKKILRSKNLVTGHPPVTVSELILKLHTIENVSVKAATLLQNGIDVIVRDQSNEFFEESHQIPPAVEQLASLSEINQFVFHTIQQLYVKHEALGSSLSKLLCKCAQKRPWDKIPEAWPAFTECAKALGVAPKEKDEW